MAINEGFTAKTAGSAIGVPNNFKQYSAVVDVTALTGGQLDNGDYIKLFYVPAGTVFQFGTFEVLTVDSGGGALYIDLATSSTHVFHSSSSLATAVSEKMDHTNVTISNQSAAYVYMYAGTADVTTAKVRVTMWVTDNEGMPTSQS